MSKHKALDTFGRSGNPVIRSSAFDAISSDPSDRMTLDGAVNKTSMLLIIEHHLRLYLGYLIVIQLFS